MTLKEKLEVQIMDLPIIDDIIDEIGTNLEYIADDFAMDFAQWTRDMGYCHYHSYAHSYKELLKMFKKEREL
jgi:hypothetical protein